MNGVEPIDLRVVDTTGVSRPRPVTGGVPFSEGALSSEGSVRLCDESGVAVPVQTRCLSHWSDGSVRWLLVEFRASPPAGGEARYRLIPCDSDGGRASHDDPIVATEAALASVGVDVRAASSDSDALVELGGRLAVGLTLVDAKGHVFVARPESVETDGGPLRSALTVRGAFVAPDGEQFLRFSFEATLHAGLGLVRLRPGIVVDAPQGVVQRIRALEMTVRPIACCEEWRVGADPVRSVGAGEMCRLFQRHDRCCEMDGVAQASESAPGWVEWRDGKGCGALALRHFWQQWPKSFEVADGGLTVGLFPAFEAGAFDDMLDPWWKHDYLFDGDCYRLRTGQARRWDVWVDLEGDGDRLASLCDRPLVVSVDPARAVASGVWGFISEAGAPGMEEYDRWAGEQFDAYETSIAAGRDYGAMNWGDWFGERHGVNWGNLEYDTANQMMLQFARTGDPKYYHAAERGARHVAEVDTVHALNPDLCAWFDSTVWDYGHESHVGMVHQHGVGHVGGFHSRERIRELYMERGMGELDPDPYPCLDPFNLGHLWTEGMARVYFQSGDAYLLETLRQIGENIALVLTEQKHELIRHTHCGRMIGWPLQALAAVCEAVPEERYLGAMREMIDVVLDAQDPNCGGWLTTLPTGHCNCETKHVGMAGFITSIMVNGLSRYYRVTGDERIPEAVERAITFLDSDTWLDERRDWRYTSCPASRPGMGWPGVTILAHVNAVRLAGNPEHARVLRRAWDAKMEAGRKHKPDIEAVDFGKTYGSKALGCPQAASLVAELITKEKHS